MPVSYVYVLVRADIPLADQVVQVGHACLEAGHRFDPPAGACHLVVLGVPSAWHLHAAVSSATSAGIRSVLFHEPDDNLGFTAACTEPVGGGLRRVFRRFSLWPSPAPDRGPRGPPHGI